MSIIREKKYNSFIYKNKQSKKKITDSNTINRIKSLRIPPAYKNVFISLDPNSKIQATGIDTKKRKQYIYNKTHVEKQSKLKFQDLIIFGKKIKRIRKDINNNIYKCSKNPRLLTDKNTIISIVLYLIDYCNFRVGSIKYKNLYNTYGVTTLNKDKFKFDKNSVYIEFIGKKGITNKSKITNKSVYNILQRLCNYNFDFVFYYTDDKNNMFRITEKHINDYLKKYNKNITVKMFRTWNSNYILLKELLKYNLPNTDSEAKKNISVAIKKAAEKLHHSSTVSKKSYMNSELVDLYLNNTNKFVRLIEFFRKTNGNLPSISRLLNLILKMIN